jgi:hypothetical protein
VAPPHVGARGAEPGRLTAVTGCAGLLQQIARAFSGWVSTSDAGTTKIYVETFNFTLPAAGKPSIALDHIHT